MSWNTPLESLMNGITVAEVVLVIGVFVLALWGGRLASLAEPD